MRKKAFCLALAGLLLLSGCGLAEQWAAVRESYIDPAVEQARTGVAPTERPNAGAGPNVRTDRAALEALPDEGALFSRLAAGPLTALTPSADYGRLLPLDGGLVTEGGVVVLDGGYEITPAAYETAAGGTAYLDAYLLYDGAAWAVCGGDGAWATDFVYSRVLPMELGLLCIYDEARNLAVCYAEDGALVFDTAEFPELYLLAAGSVASLAQCSGGYMRCEYTNGQVGFVDADGAILNRHVDLPSFFDEALPFSEGLAAVCNGGVWGYLDAEGAFAIPRELEAAGSFTGGLAAVRRDGVWCVIDRSGEVLREFAGVDSLAVYDGYIVADGAYYTVTDFEPAVFYGYEGTPCAGGFWVRGENGVRVFLRNGNQVYFSGAAALLGRAGELWSLELADGTRAVMDANSRVVAFGDTGFVTDRATGETYIWSAADGGSLRDASGAVLATGATGLVAGGCAECVEGLWRGWKNAQNEWIVRVPHVAAD